MPNIRKMKEKEDIEGLIKEIRNKKPRVRIEAVKALGELKNIEGLIEALYTGTKDVTITSAELLKDINDPKAIDNLNKKLISFLKYGDLEEQIEAISLIQGRYPVWFMISCLENWGEIEEVFKKVKKKMNLEPFREPLIGVVKQERYYPCMWYSLIGLIELGDRSNRVLNLLIDISQKWFQKLQDQRSLITFGASTSLPEETLRALSYFRNNKSVTELTINALNDKFLGASKINAIYALGALGDPSEMERLEYIAKYDTESNKKAARIALDLYGKATYDEIKLKANLR